MPIRPTNKKLSWKPEQQQFDRVRKHQHLYNSWKWKKIRKLFLQKNPKCVKCLEFGIQSAATVVDHVIPYKEGDNFFDTNNYQSMCKKHHDSKSATERGGMGLKHK